MFVERYRYLIGSVLLGLILAGSAFLWWRENKWKPGMENRLSTLELQLEELESASIPAGESAQTSDVNPSDLISQSQTTAETSQPKSGKVAGASTTTKTPSKTATSSAPATSSSSSAPASAPTSGKPPLPSTPININTASAYELTALPGIGTVTAQSIIDYRNAHGAFRSIQELDNVKNIGQATINKIRDHITVN